MNTPATQFRPPERGLVVRHHYWRHAVEWSALLGALAFLLVTIRPVMHWPDGVPAALLVAAGLISAGFAIVTKSHMAVTAYLLGSAGVLAAWATAALYWSPWTRPMVYALILTVIMMVPAGVLAWSAHDSEGDRVRALAESRRRHGAFARYADALDHAGFPDVLVTTMQKTRAGRVVHLLLPDHGQITCTRLQSAIEAVEVALPGNLRHGSVRFEPGASARLVTMHITERDVLAEAVPFPANAVTRTINDPFGVGLREDGHEATVLFRQVAALIIGTRGSGKSNLMNVLIAQLSWCADVVIFAIDMKGGRTVKPWLAPWANRQCPRPAIDWIATDRDEVERMLAALLRAIEARAFNLKGSKVKPSTATPAIVLLVDEVAVVFGMYQRRPGEGQATNSSLAALGAQLTQLGRSEAIDPIWCSLRATVTMLGGGDLKSQCRLRFGLGTASESDARSIIEDDQRAARLLSKLMSSGSMIIWDGNRAPMPVKAYRLDADDDADRITQIATDTGWIRPAPDKLTADAMGEDYAKRWERAQGLIDVLAGPEPADPTDRDFGDIVARIEDPESRLNPAHKRMREIIAASGRAWSSPAAIHVQLRNEGRGVARETIQRWLAADKVAGLMETGRHGQWRIRQSDDSNGQEATGA